MAQLFAIMDEGETDAQLTFLTRDFWRKSQAWPQLHIRMSVLLHFPTL